MFQSPLWIHVPGRRNQQGMVAARIERRADLQGPILNFGRSTSASQTVTTLPQHADGFGAKKVAAVSKTNRLRHVYFFELILNKREFARQSGCVSGNGEVGMGPRVVPDLESHRMDLSHITPAHEVFRISHPVMGDKECGAESKLLQERRYKAPVRFDRIIEREHHQLLRYVGSP